ncbi:aminoglycoside 3'-phosphotransferase [Herbidospora galbida]|uniref:Aminoglycoside 3'-phosphotransferase n=1 Tax=Herbidospora galbida TaxID=2575442 RepID=A0A4U3MI75_9ACTN|nr:aminoglycoside 3'-phosphotransferase [Herbidospora galbida]TKK88991.1 aminoglycoside 3'-phosphotransferase [Herbidospora galbida]
MFRDLLGHDDWTPVGHGESGARVFRSADGARYAKCGPAAELTAERDRLAWLAGHDVPGQRVLDWRTAGDRACLVTSAVDGVPAHQVSPGELERAWQPIAEAVRRLHGLPGCPFSRDLDWMLARAEDVVARGAVNPDFLPEEQVGTPPPELLARLRPELDLRREQEARDGVVCHGDLTLPNVILDPESLTVAGFVDVGRLGRADPHADLVLLFATADEIRPGLPREGLFGLDPDPGRLRFYLHLDPLTWG